MPQELNQTTRSTFNKGLLTEFSELNFPNEASIDELNCSLFKAGNRTRRLGIEYEFANQFSSETYNPGILYGTGKWINVGKNSSVDYLVVQVGPKLKFYQRGSDPLSASEVSYEVDMTPYEKAGGLGAASSHVELASIEGHLVVASPQINTFYVSRDTDGNFSQTQIDFKIRDFKYLTDRISLTSEATAAVTAERDYDTRNCGWVGDKGDAALTTYTTANTYYPPLTHPWYSGKDASGNFSVTEWEEIYAGNSLIVNGHYVLDLFDQDRETVSGITGVESTTIEDRFSAVASFAGRVFFGGVGTRVYFSRLLEDISDIGNLYQINDPTSEEISDLLDTDGGWIDIPEASGINKLHVFGSALLVFANNGVWRVTGVDNVFRATEYSVYRVTDEGLAYRKSFVSGQNAVPLWWSYTGIQTIQVTDEGGMVAQNISRDTIQTFWSDISSSAKGFVQGVYDGLNDRALWMYPNSDETVDYKLNNILFLDITLGAFYPWKISDKATDTPYILGGAFFDESGSDTIDFTVVDGDGNTVVSASGDDVVVSREAGTISSSEISFLTRAPDGTLTFSTFSDDGFLDWGEADYTSYAEAAYNFMGDLSRRKNAPYITVFMRVTETGWEQNLEGNYELVRPSSLKVSSYWDFRNITSTTAQEAYRLKLPLIVDSDVFDYPTSVIATRLKMRGRGRVMRVRFESSTGKDFNLLGWETIGARNRTL